MVQIDLRGRRELRRGTLSPRFAQLPELRTLFLGNTLVSGDVAALQNLTELKGLNLHYTKVAGDIAALANLRELRYLNLGITDVIGDLAALKDLRELEELDLRDTNVIGDMAALKNLRELEELDLSDTNVIGDMAALENATSLGNNFNIDGSKITCEEAALRTVLLKLGLEAEQLTDLKNSGGVTRMLSCRNTKFFLHMIWADQTGSCLARVTQSMLCWLT